MKSKNETQIPSSGFWPMRYPALSFGLIVAWLYFKFQADRLLGGSREPVFYPLLIMAGFPDTWIIGAILSGLMVYIHVRALSESSIQRFYKPLILTSETLQAVMLLIGTVFFSSSVVHLQSLSTHEHRYHLMQGSVNTIGGFVADVVMECDSEGLICHSRRAFIQQGGCFAKDAHLALDPDTKTLLFHTGQDAYPVIAPTDEAFSYNICADLIRPALERS